MMTPRRNLNPADQVKYLTEALKTEYAKLEECFRNISEIADQLRRVADDSTQRLLTRD